MKRLLVILLVLNIFTACSNKNMGNVDEKISSSPNPTLAPIQTIEPTPTPTPMPTVTPIEINTEKVKQSDELYEQGFELYNNFKYSEAIKYYDKSLQLNDNNYKALTGKGISLCFLGDYANGIPFIDKALKIKPDYAPAHFNMAMAYKLQKDYNNSLIWFNSAVKIDPTDAWSYYGIATIYADWNDTENALFYLKKAIDLDSSVKGVAKQQDHFASFRANPEFQKLVQ